MDSFLSDHLNEIFAKANFYFDRFGRRQSISKAFATEFYQYPNFDLVLNAMIQNGARYSCLDRPQTCPLLWLSQCKTKDPTALIKIFYECKPHVSDEHLRQCLSTAVKKGSLPIICALLQLDQAAASPTEIVAKLAENRVHWDLVELIHDGHNELAIFVGTAVGWVFVPKTVAFAIRQNFLIVAQNMINSRITAPQTRLSLQDSNSIWKELSLYDWEHVQTAITLGVAPTDQCLRKVVGHFETRCYDNKICLRDYAYLNTNYVWDKPSVVFQKIDLFVGLDVQIDSAIISNAAGSGHYPVLEYVLQLWVTREDYRDVCIVRPLAVHNAFMHQDWDMGLHCSRKPISARDDDADGDGGNSAGVEDEYWPRVPTPYPSRHDDDFFYSYLPELVALGVYGDKIYDKVLEEMAFHSHEWSLEKVAFAFDKIHSMGATVSGNCLRSACFDGKNWNRMTPRFPYFLDKFEFDPKRQPTVEDDKFFLLDELAGAITYADTTLPINLVLAKGIRPCVDALYSAFSSQRRDTELRDGIKAMFASAEPGSEAHSRFIERMVIFQLPHDFEQDEIENLQDLLEFMKELGYSCSEKWLGVAIERELPYLAGMLLPFVVRDDDAAVDEPTSPRLMQEPAPPAPPLKAAAPSKKDATPAAPLFASFGRATAAPVRVTLLWMALRAAAVATLALAALLRLGSGVVSRGIQTAEPCQESLSKGHWTAKKNWMVDTCAIAKYQPNQAIKCLADSRVIMIGDSSMRAVFTAFQLRLGAKKSEVEVDSTKKHADLSAKYGSVQLNFYWDPWLNRTDVNDVLKGSHASSSTSAAPKTSLVMVSAGAWFLRYGGEQSAAIETFSKRMVNIKDMVNERSKKGDAVADTFITRLLPPFDESKLSEERRLTLQNELRLKYNHYLFQLVPDFGKADQSKAPFQLGTVGLQILTAAEGMTTDGLHYLPEIDAVEVELLLNQICNERVFAGTKQQGKTSCCVNYPTTPIGVWIIVLLLLAFGPAALYCRRVKPHFEPKAIMLLYPTEKTAYAIGILGLTVISCLTVDRSTLFVKVNKEFSVLEFLLLNLLWILPGFWSMRVGKDSTFLNRDQTDEWKGWMQFSILVYHFTGASKVIPVYAVIRVMGDFSFIRLARVLVRLNLLMSFWFLVVYGTMGIYSAGNTNPSILLLKLVVSNLLAYAFTHFPSVYTPFFSVCETLFQVRWNAKEAAFRLALDQYAVHFGMLAAWLMISLKSAESSATAVPGTYNWLSSLSTTILNRWQQVKRLAVLIVPLTKTQNNAYHPFVSLVVLSAFIILRNSTENLRKTTSVFWRWIGGFSLETFILQYHVWLAVDTYGVLDWLGPGVLGKGEFNGVMKWFGFFMGSIVFLALSEVLGEASGVLVEAVVVGGLGKGPDTKHLVQRVGVWMVLLILWNWVLV
ncbi:10 TM acyl transferase domain found in Cas1p-domain-containing protein [Obelidium mucronatum]|nr:10 TM acyl transferase domain found in Cas1p-domain-containing protein [Obelidium mucronatum]